MLKDEEEQRLTELKGHWELTEELDDAVEELSEDGRSLGVTGVLNVESVAVTPCELMPKAAELLLNENDETFQSTIIGVNNQLR